MFLDIFYNNISGILKLAEPCPKFIKFFSIANYVVKLNIFFSSHILLEVTLIEPDLFILNFVSTFF
jgi:hypothetical protein